MADAQFLFETNIDAVAGKVETQLRRIQAELEGFRNNQPAAARGPLDSYLQGLDAKAADLIRKVRETKERIAAEMSAAGPGAKLKVDFGREVETLLAQFSGSAEKLGANARKAMDANGMGAEFEAASKHAAGSFKQAFEAVFAQLRVELRALAKEAGVTGVRTPTPASLKAEQLPIVPPPPLPKRYWYEAKGSAPTGPFPTKHEAEAHAARIDPQARVVREKPGWLAQQRAKLGMDEETYLASQAVRRDKAWEKTQRPGWQPPPGSAEMEARLAREAHERQAKAEFDKGRAEQVRVVPSPGAKGDAFDKLAQAQRGKPEEAMLALQKAVGGGALSYTAEHVGDLTHRMSEWATRESMGYDLVKNKVDKTLSALESGYGFGREHGENLKDNYEYAKKHEGYKGTQEAYEREVAARQQAYADAHKKLKPINEAQRVARDAAVALGEGRYDDATAQLRTLKAHLGSKEAWVQYAGQGAPTDAGGGGQKPPKKPKTAAASPDPDDAAAAREAAKVQKTIENTQAQIALAKANAAKRAGASAKLDEVDEFIKRIAANTPRGYAVDAGGARFRGLKDVAQDTGGKLWRFDRDEEGVLTGRSPFTYSQDRLAAEHERQTLERDRIATEAGVEKRRMADMQLERFREGTKRSAEVSERLLANMTTGVGADGKPLFQSTPVDPRGTIHANQYVRDRGAYYKFGQQGTLHAMDPADAEYVKAVTALTGKTDALEKVRAKEIEAEAAAVEKQRQVNLRATALDDIRQGRATQMSGHAVYPSGAAVKLNQQYALEATPEQAALLQQQVSAAKQKAADAERAEIEKQAHIDNRKWDSRRAAVEKAAHDENKARDKAARELRVSQERLGAEHLRDMALADVVSGRAQKYDRHALYPDGRAVKLNNKYAEELSADDALLKQVDAAHTQALALNKQRNKAAERAVADEKKLKDADARADQKQIQLLQAANKTKIAALAATGQAQRATVPGMGTLYQHGGKYYYPSGMPVRGSAQQAAAAAAFGGPPMGPGGPGGPGGKGPFGGFFSREGPGGKPGLSPSRVLGSITSLGSYFAAAAVYGTLFKIVSDTKNEILAMEEAQTSLTIALGEGSKVTADYSQELGNIASKAGENVSTALETAARGIRVFADASASQQERESIGASVAYQAQQLGVIASKPLGDATGDLLAIGTAFGLTESNLSRVNDAIAVAKNELGGSENDIAQGLASIAGAAAAAGFTIEQTANMISLMASRTDQSGRTVATRGARILNILSGTTGQAVVAELGQSAGIEFDKDSTTAQRFLQIGRAYDGMTQSQKQFVESKVGGTANLRELVAVLSEFERFEEVNAISVAGSGEGAAQYAKIMDNLSRQIKEMVGEWTNLQTNLGQSGIFDVLAGLIEPITQLLKLVNLLVESWNNMPRVMRAAAMAMLEYVAAAKLLGKILASRGTAMHLPFVGTVGSPHAVPGAGPGFHGPPNPNALRGATKLGAAASNLAYSAAGNVLAHGPKAALGMASSSVAGAVKSGVTRGFTAARSGLNSAFASPFAKFFGALVAVELIGASWEAGKKWVDGVNAAGGPLVGATFGDRQAELQGRAQTLRENRDEGLKGAFLNFLDNQNGNIDVLEARARFSGEAEARGGKAQAEAARGLSPLIDVFNLSSVDGILQGFKLLDDYGRDATEQMDALVEVMQRLSDASNGVKVALSDNQVLGIGDEIGELVGSIYASVTEDLSNQRSFFGGQLGHADSVLDAMGKVDLAAMQGGAADIVNEFLTNQPDVDLNTDMQARAQVAERLRTYFTAQYSAAGLEGEDLTQQVDYLVSGIMGNLSGLVEGGQVLADQSLVIGQMLKAAVNTTKENAALRGLQAAGSGGFQELVTAQQNLAGLRQIYGIALSNKHTTPQMLNQLRAEILQAEQELIKAENSRIDTLTKVAQAALPLSDEVGRAQVEIDNLRKQIENTTEGDARDQLKADLRERLRKQRFTILDRENARLDAGVDSRDTVGTAVREVATLKSQLDAMAADGDTSSAEYYKTLKAYRDAQLALVQTELDAAHASRLADIDPRNVLGEALAELTDARARLAAALPGTQGHDEARRRVAEAELNVREEQEAIRLARAAVGNDPRSKVQGARQSVAEAASALSLALPGTAEYFEALRNLKDAQIDLADVLRAAKLTEAILAGDFTNPIEQAQHAVRDAINAYFEALSQGAPTDVLNDLELNKRKTQDDLEATMQSEKLRRAKTAYDLGDISHQQYVDLLKAELAWYDQQIELTYAQQDRQMEVRQALEAATSEMEGMFNLGDIRVPTPFEVRRAMAQATAGISEILNGGAYGGAGGGVTNTAVVTTNNVVINGADFAKVVAYLEAVFGPGAIQRTTPVGARSI